MSTFYCPACSTRFEIATQDLEVQHSPVSPLDTALPTSPGMARLSIQLRPLCPVDYQPLERFAP